MLIAGIITVRCASKAKLRRRAVTWPTELLVSIRAVRKLDSECASIEPVGNEVMFKLVG